MQDEEIIETDDDNTNPTGAESPDNEGAVAGEDNKPEEGTEEQPTESDEGAESAPHGEETAEGEAAKPKGSGKIQKRFDKLTAEKYEAKKEAEEARKRAEELQRKLEEIEAMGTLATPTQEGDGDNTPPKMPKEEDFEDYSDYVKAAAMWSQEMAEYKAQQIARQSIEEYHRANMEYKRQQVLNAKLEYGRQKYGDEFDKEVRDPNKSYISQQLVDAALTANHTADILFHLAKNPTLGMRIASMSPQAMAVEIGKLDVQLQLQDQQRQPDDATPKKETPPVSNAPDPISPLSGGKAQAPNIYAEDLSYDEYRRMRMAQIKQQYGIKE